MVELVILVIEVLKVIVRFCIGEVSESWMVVMLVVFCRVRLVLCRVFIMFSRVLSMFSNISRLIRYGVSIGVGRVVCLFFMCRCMVLCRFIGMCFS